MAGTSLLSNVLSHFCDCCRTYPEHKLREPRRPKRMYEPGGNDQTELKWVDYERAHGTWQLNHYAHKEQLGQAATLITHSSFNDTEKAEIVDRLHLLARHHKNDEVIMGHLQKICKAHNLPDFAAVRTS